MTEETDRKEEGRKDILKSLRNLMIAHIVSYLLMGALGITGFALIYQQSKELGQVTETTAAALCALRNDLQSRVDAGKAFLEENPDGIPGISDEQIRQSLEGQERTILALAILDCPPPAIVP